MRYSFSGCAYGGANAQHFLDAAVVIEVCDCCDCLRCETDRSWVRRLDASERLECFVINGMC